MLIHTRGYPLDKVFVGLVTTQNTSAEVRITSVERRDKSVQLVSCLVCQTHINPTDINITEARC